MISNNSKSYLSTLHFQIMKILFKCQVILGLFLLILGTTFAYAQNRPPHDSVVITADIPYNDILASGTAYIYQSPSNFDLGDTKKVRNPIILLEGLDLDNSRNSNELYDILNQQKLAECLLNNGYDLILLNFKDSKLYIQSNAFMFVKLMEIINDSLKVGQNGDIVIGASTGGVVARYGLAYMEKNNVEHQTRLFSTFDTPHKGANIPLGDQYFIDFFAALSPDAKKKIGGLNSTAPRQLLVYHHLVFPVGNKDVLYIENPHSTSDRNTLIEELNILGYPKKCRKVAISNGSGYGLSQPFAPQDQLIRWHAPSAIIGDTWAVPNLTESLIADLYLDIVPLFLDKSLLVSIKNSLPYDNAPGGFRVTNRDIADGSTHYGPFTYGDIITANPAHCFIPTISALDINTTDLFYNIAGDPDILSKTPFDAIYYPPKNQEHVFISPHSVDWVLNELVPDTITHDGSKWDQGEIKAKKSIRFLPGFHADPESNLHATIGSYSKDPIANNTIYRITVFTGSKSNAGTNASLYITLFGDEKNSGETKIDNEDDNLEKGQTDVYRIPTDAYHIPMEDVGNLKSIRIRHDNKGASSGWFLNKIIIDNESTGQQWTFGCNCWLATDEGDGKIDRTLMPD